MNKKTTLLVLIIESLRGRAVWIRLRPKRNSDYQKLTFHNVRRENMQVIDTTRAGLEHRLDLWSGCVTHSRLISVDFP